MSDTNQAVQPQKIARDLKFKIEEVDGLHYLCRRRGGLVVERRMPEREVVCSILTQVAVLYP